MADIDTSALPLIVVATGWLLREIVGAMRALRGNGNGGEVSKRPKPCPNYVTREEFLEEIGDLRVRIERILSALTGRM